MHKTKNILLVTNSTTEEEVALIKAALAASDMDIQLNLVHVIPSLPTCYFNIPSTVLLAERYYEEAEKALSSVGQILNVTKDNQWLITGRIKNEVFRLARQLGAEFILASKTNLSELYKSLQNSRKDRHLTLIQNLNTLANS